jgi:murein DD-endopeptidase MepM/ murein hydrolase activator NlpD
MDGLPPKIQLGYHTFYHKKDPRVARGALRRKFPDQQQRFRTFLLWRSFAVIILDMYPFYPKGVNMQSRHSAASDPKVRPINRFTLALAQYRRILLAVMLTLTVAASGSIGYLLGNTGPAEAASVVDDTDSVAAFTNQLAAEDDLCSIVEQINLQDQLSVEKAKTADLEKSLDTQQNEIDSLEEKILGVLMANLSEKTVSRSGTTIAAYHEEAASLISLSRKLKTFKKTETAGEIDLTTYESAINKRLLRLPTLKPISGRIDGYGYRRHPIYGNYEFHPAADMGAARGTPIKAAGSGRVIVATYSSSAGNYIKIDHGNGFTTTYMHCSKLNVTVGATVTKGQVIGNVGSTGTSTTPHLHFEIRLNGNPVNPKTMIME